MHPNTQTCYDRFRTEQLKEGESVGVADEHHMLYRQWGKVVKVDENNTVIVEFCVRPNVDKVWRQIDTLKDVLKENEVIAKTKMLFHRFQLTQDSGY
jgi:hypothetical protein